MNNKKIALLLACGVSMGLAAISGSAFAADHSTQKPAASQPDPKAHEKDHCDKHESGMMGNEGSMVESPRMKMVMMLDLSNEQRSKINKLSDQLHHDNWAIQGSMMDETAKLRDLYEADKRDPATIGNEYRKIFDLKRQMIEAMIDTQNHIEALLTPEQLAQLKNMHHMHESMHESMHGHAMH